MEGPVGCGYGECAAQGTARCVGGALELDCAPRAPLSPDESSCDGLDNDCDGRVDEGFMSTTSSCGDGVCAARGSSSCARGALSLNCAPLPPTGADADCDALDNDCDASTDEDYPPVIDRCGVGACATSAPSSCVGGAVQNNCVPLNPLGDDVTCDGVDDDCDGLVDESYTPTPTTCTFGIVCVQPGLKQCVSGRRVDVCDPPSFFTGSDNSCDAQDNDCDGVSDEGYVGGVYYCGAGVCRRSGNRSCSNGVEAGGSCTPGAPTGNDADCNGVDEDCDGAADESYGVQPSACGRGVCRRAGTQTCAGGSYAQQCAPGQPTGVDDDNDGLDNDCDGQTDEDYNPPPPPAETNCDGRDNDLDGRVDEGYVSTPTSCTSGACSGTGALICSNGSVVDTCVAAAGGPDNNCDGVDDDCDGSADESYSGVFDRCGVGACKRSGFYICVNGGEVHNCTPGQPSAEVGGNSVDEDCDGLIDEGGGGGGDPCGPNSWSMSRAFATLDEVCAGLQTVLVTTRVLVHSNPYTSVLNEVVCLASTRQLVNGNNNYFVTNIVNANQFDYWQIDGSGVARDNGTFTCGGAGGGGR